MSDPEKVTEVESVRNTDPAKGEQTTPEKAEEKTAQAIREYYEAESWQFSGCGD